MGSLKIKTISSEWTADHYDITKKGEPYVLARSGSGFTIWGSHSILRIPLFRFALDNGKWILGGYDDETETVIMTEHEDLPDALSIGMAANYIEFLLTMPEICREEVKGCQS